jgi:hypothetical protein
MQWHAVKQALDTDTIATTGGTIENEKSASIPPPPPPPPPPAPTSPTTTAPAATPEPAPVTAPVTAQPKPAGPSVNERPRSAPVAKAPVVKAPSPKRPPGKRPPPRKPAAPPAEPTLDKHDPYGGAVGADDDDADGERKSRRGVADQSEGKDAKASKPAKKQNKPAPVTSRPADEARDDERSEEAGAPDGSSNEDARVTKDVAAAEPPRAVSEDYLNRVEQGQAETVAITGSSGRALRLTAALGGGLAIEGGSRGLLALNVRVESNRRLAIGGEASLWLLDGADPQGRALVTIARRGIARWLELGAGAGLHLGGGTGPAAALRLRIDTPIAPLAGFLRYDAALRVDRPSLEVEHAITLGIELSY